MSSEPVVGYVKRIDLRADSSGPLRWTCTIRCIDGARVEVEGIGDLADAFGGARPRTNDPVVVDYRARTVQPVGSPEPLEGITAMGVSMERPSPIRTYAGNELWMKPWMPLRGPRREPKTGTYNIGGQT